MKTPGVFIEEISTLPASIASVETAIPAFIGYTKDHASHASINLEAAPASGNAVTKPVKISSLKQYVDFFGGADVAGLTVNVTDTYDGSNLSDRSVSATYTDYSLYESMKLFFANGGGQCYIISVGASVVASSMTAQQFMNGIDAIKKEDEPTLIVFPQASLLTGGSGTEGDAQGSVVVHALSQCKKLQDRFVITDVNKSYLDIDSTTNYAPKDFRAFLGMNDLDYGAIYYPSVLTGIDFNFEDANVVLTNHTTTSTSHAGSTIGNIRTTDTGLYNAIKTALAAVQTEVPVSGAVAGIYAQVDGDRGVWKAPANVSLSSVIAPTQLISDLDQRDLNVDVVAGKSINAIRTFSGKGNIVWGARTMDGNDNEWRYVNVRRLFIYAEESIKKAMEAYVFEPNTAQTWVKLKGGIENFLTELWRQGGLTGAKASDAYFVSIGLGTTMTSEDILEGKLNIEIGLAASRPAEFIVLKFSQQQQVS